MKKSDIASRASAPSGMPQIYNTDAVLTKTQLHDLMEYLASLKSAPSPSTR